MVELGLPLGRKTPPPPDVPYAVITEDGVRERYGCDVATWCLDYHAETVYLFKLNRALNGRDRESFADWRLVKLNH